MICESCGKLIVPGTLAFDLFRLTLISEGGEALLAKSVCRKCAEGILKALTPFEKKAPKEEVKEEVKKRKGGVKK